MSSSAEVGGSGNAGESMMVSGGRVHSALTSTSTSDDAGDGDVV